MRDEYQYPGGRHRTGAMPWLAAGAAVVVGVFAIAFAVMLTGNKSPAGPSQPHHPRAVAAQSLPAVTTPTPSASPSHKPAHKPTHSASPSPPPAHTSRPPAAGPHSPPPPPKPPAGSVHLAASVSADGWQGSQTRGWVGFQVNDTGSAASGQVTVTIALPSGASMSSGGGGGGDGGGGGGGGGDTVLRQADGNSGWNCQPTSTGATCTHSGLAAGGHSWGAIFFTVTGTTSVCGQPVNLTAASGSVSASAQSTIAC